MKVPNSCLFYLTFGPTACILALMLWELYYGLQHYTLLALWAYSLLEFLSKKPLWLQGMVIQNGPLLPYPNMER